MRVWYRPMVARGATEKHRTATPLELLFDLCFVVAVAAAAAGLHHELTENHLGKAVLNYALVFFAIWWAWLNFTWFASAYDTDDVPYRLVVLLQIAGCLTLAAGVPAAFERDFTVITVGYVVIRAAMIIQWLRAAKSDPPRRRCAYRFAYGIALVQIGWVLRLLLPESLFLWGFFALVIAELVVPIWAERAGPTIWHPHHIVERYGLFTLIVLGESILAATTAIRSGLNAGDRVETLLSLAGAGLIILFSLWWLYFSQQVPKHLRSLRGSLTWGYGHFFIFSSIAAVGAGISVAVDYDLHQAHISGLAAGLATTVPVAIYILSVWLLHVNPSERKISMLAFPVTAVLVLLASLSPAPIHFTAGLLAVLVTATVLARQHSTVPVQAS